MSLKKRLKSKQDFAEKTGWTFIKGPDTPASWDGAGVAKAGHFYLDQGAGNGIKQTVMVSADGRYKVSASLNTGGTGGIFGIRIEGEEDSLKSVEISGSSRTVYTLEGISLEKDTKVEIYVSGATAWINGDDFEFTCTELNKEDDDSGSSDGEDEFQHNIENQNLLVNPEFDDGVNGWSIVGTGGYGSNNGHPSGTQHFYLNGNTSYEISQTVTIPADGVYEVSAWLVKGGSGGTFGVRKTGEAEALKSVDISDGAYTEYCLNDISLKKGDKVVIYVTAASGWTNGDQFDFSCTKQTGEAGDSQESEEQEPDYIFSGNMILNPSFTENTAWSFYGHSGYANNNGHNGNGDRHFHTQNTSSGLKQQIYVPYTGYYKAGIHIASAGTGAEFGVNNLTTEENSKVVLATNTQYSEYTVEIWANKGDRLEVFVKGGNNWANGDDISLEYNLSRFENMVVDPEDTAGDGWKQSSGAVSQKIYIPQDGAYYAEVTLENAENAVVFFAGSESSAVNGNETVKVEVSGLEAKDYVELKISGTADVKKAIVKFDLTKIPNEAPTAADVTVQGECTADLQIEGIYTFYDQDGHTEGNSAYQWMISDEAEGTYTAIEGATSKLLTVDAEWEDKYLKFSVTPVDQYEKAGNMVLSEPIGPVDINLIQDPGFESNAQGWNGVSISNSGAYAGLVRGIVTAHGTGTQSIDVPRSAYYDLSAQVRYSGTATGNISVQDEAGNVLGSVKIESTNGEWAEVTIDNIPLEEGQNVKLVLEGVSSGSYDVDAFSLKRDRTQEVPAFANIKKIVTEPEAYSATIDNYEKEITLEYTYGTDLSNIVLKELSVSEGATASIKVDDDLDLEDELRFTLTDSEQSVVDWKIVAKEREKRVVLESSNDSLEETFNWAANKIDQFVVTGTKNGIINKSESGSGTIGNDYIPSYWAGYFDRTAFYSRDFVHQATGAQIAGLADENYSMFSAFAKECNEARQWYTVWALNFDGSVYTLDYRNENNFVREIPAQFELVEKAYKQYLWSGDERYIKDETLWAFYTNVMTNYVDTHDGNENGVAQEVGTGIFNGSATYNERGGRQVIEAGDSIGSQYQATLAYAGMLKARGEAEEAEIWYQKAADLKKYFNETWSVTDNMSSEYVCAWGPNGERYSDFSKETSWFIPLKMISEAGERNDAYIDFILENLGNGIGTTNTAPANIEAYTYIPDMLFLYNRSDDAWKWMEYIASVKDNAHEKVSQGTNGDYPEISFTYISHTIEGMMGVEPDAGEGFVATSPRLPQEVPDAKAKYMQIGNYELDLEHVGNTESTLTNHADKEITWEVRFYGDHDYIKVDDKIFTTESKEINGEIISYVTTKVAAGKAVNAKVVSKDEADAENKADAEEVAAKIDAIGEVTLNNKAVVENARAAYEALSEEAKAMVTNLNVLEAAEAKLKELGNAANQGGQGGNSSNHDKDDNKENSKTPTEVYYAGEKTTTSSTTAAKTGDSSNIVELCAAMLLAAAGIWFVIVKRRKNISK